MLLYCSRFHYLTYVHLHYYIHVLLLQIKFIYINITVCLSELR